eukprot:COSAG06_NODE_27766_length_587_cov_0.547131_1_plen_28_part_01
MPVLDFKDAVAADKVGGAKSSEKDHLSS